MKFSYFSVHFVFGWQWELTSLPSFWQEIWSSSDDSLLFTSLTFLFSCIWDLSLQELFLSFWGLCLLCSSSSFLALALEEWDLFLVSSSLSIYGLSEVFIASMTFLEIWLPSVVICCPKASANLSKQFPIWVTSGSWIGGSVISLIFKVSLLWLLVLAMILEINAFKKVDCIDINGYKILICSSSLPLLQPCPLPWKKWPWLARWTLSINPEQMKWEGIKVHEKNMSCECALNFDQWKTFAENYKPMRVWLWLVYKFTKNFQIYQLFSEFVETKKRYPTSFDKIRILTLKQLVISS